MSSGLGGNGGPARGGVSRAGTGAPAVDGLSSTHTPLLQAWLSPASRAAAAGRSAAASAAAIAIAVAVAASRRSSLPLVATILPLARFPPHSSFHALLRGCLAAWLSPSVIPPEATAGAPPQPPPPPPPPRPSRLGVRWVPPPGEPVGWCRGGSERCPVGDPPGPRRCHGRGGGASAA